MDITIKPYFTTPPSAIARFYCICFAGSAFVNGTFCDLLSLFPLVQDSLRREVMGEVHLRRLLLHTATFRHVHARATALIVPVSLCPSTPVVTRWHRRLSPGQRQGSTMRSERMLKRRKNLGMQMSMGPLATNLTPKIVLHHDDNDDRWSSFVASPHRAHLQMFCFAPKCCFPNLFWNELISQLMLAVH